MHHASVRTRVWSPYLTYGVDLNLHSHFPLTLPLLTGAEECAQATDRRVARVGVRVRPDYHTCATTLLPALDERLRTFGGRSTWKYETWFDGHSLHAPIGSFKSNPFGLHDMHGNVWEFCQDVWSSLSYRNVEPREGSGLRFSLRRPSRVTRGGCFSNNAITSRSSVRMAKEWSIPDSKVGIRPARMIQR